MLACRGLVLAGVGLWLGALASTSTSESLKRLGPPPTERAAAQDLEPNEAIGPAIAWARTAYAFGLRDCPRVTEIYYAACQKQMKEEERLAAEWKRQQAQWARAEPQIAYSPELEPVRTSAVEQASYELARDFPIAEPGEEEPTPPAPEDVDGVVAPPSLSSPPAG